MKTLSIRTMTCFLLICIDCMVHGQSLPLLKVFVTPPEISVSRHYPGAIAISDNRAIVGDMSGGVVDSYRGDVLLFDKSSSELKGPLVAGFDASVMELSQFASDIAVHGKKVIVGAKRSATFAAGAPVGAALIFDVETGEQTQLLMADREKAGFNSMLGFSVDINGSYAAAGDNRGNAFVFDAGTGEELFQFITDSVASTDVSLFEDLLVLGVTSSVSVFDLTTGESVLELPSFGDGRFGRSVEIGEDRVFVQSETLLSSYDLTGSLLAQVENTSTANHRNMAYSDGKLAALTVKGNSVVGASVYDAETLEIIGFVDSPFARSVALEGNELLVSSELDLRLYAVPEPLLGEWAVFLVGVAVLSIRKRNSSPANSSRVLSRRESKL